MLVGTCFLNALYTTLPCSTSLTSFDETCGTIGFVGKGHEVEDVVCELWRVGIKLGYGVDTQRCIVDYLANVVYNNGRMFVFVFPCLQGNGTFCYHECANTRGFFE